MDEPERPATTDPEVEVEPEPAVELPPGSHPLEVAARRGIGPLSPRGREVWHGHARPCVSCGQLVLHDAAECDECGQDLSQEMLEKMRANVEEIESLAAAYGEMANVDKAVDDEINAALDGGSTSTAEESLLELKKKMGIT